MNSWRDHVLKEFTPKVSRLTLVSDPDGLLLEEGILEGIRKRGFDLIPFEDHVAFRFAYESKYRSCWDRGEQTDLVVLLRSEIKDIDGLPYDLLQSGRKLFFNVGDVFPKLSHPVIAALDRSYFEILYQAQKLHAPGELGENATKEFILRHVFEIAPELIRQPSNLMQVLLRRHYRGQVIPPVLDERLIQLLQQNKQFVGWPLETIVKDREAFFTFLQERWPTFLDKEAVHVKKGVYEAHDEYHLALKGPVDLPFDHHDIRIYIDNLFMEGFLHPVQHEHADELSRSWVAVGIQTNAAEDCSRRLCKLAESLKAAIPAEDAKHSDWSHFARSWAKLMCLVNEEPSSVPATTKSKIRALQTQIDIGFSTWLFKRYAGLINLPPAPPVMLHHIPRFIARQMSDAAGLKVALLVVDGLSLDQWLVVKNILGANSSSFIFREKTVFAWIPSITSISRQAAFSGKIPAFFPDSIYTTEKESLLWSQFWTDQGLSQNEVVYIKGLGDGSLDMVSEMISSPKARVVGLVVDKVDRIMHGMELGAAGMHNQVDQWARQLYLQKLVDLLLDQGFRVYLTSDHGNIDAEGCGRPAEGVIADLRGERVRIYPDIALRTKIKGQFPAAIEWNNVGIPDDCVALLAPHRQAFIETNRSAITHGGLSMEEIIVPFVQIERKIK
ncbi:MAG TPA: BREX-3 system phosphatase PglZ [Smithella sp.]|nr:BREX-3 system phosphatase PglZ [Smithella sp.]